MIELDVEATDTVMTEARHGARVVGGRRVDLLV